MVEFTDDVEVEIRLARFEHLIERRLLLLNSVLLRQNPHNVHEWLKRVKLYEGKPHDVSIINKVVKLGQWLNYIAFIFFLKLSATITGIFGINSIQNYFLN